MKIDTALILCAGFGKRLAPLTLKKPKPLLEVNNKTMLENCIKLIIKLDIKKILLNTHYLGDQIFEFIKKKNFTRFVKSKFSTTKNGKIEVKILKGQESFRIRSFIQSNIWVLFPAGKSKFKKGETVDCFFPNLSNKIFLLGGRMKKVINL